MRHVPHLGVAYGNNSRHVAGLTFRLQGCVLKHVSRHYHLPLPFYGHLTRKFVSGSKSASLPLPESVSYMSEVSSAARQAPPSCHTTQLTIGPAADHVMLVSLRGTVSIGQQTEPAFIRELPTSVVHHGA